MAVEAALFVPTLSPIVAALQPHVPILCLFVTSCRACQQLESVSPDGVIPIGSMVSTDDEKRAFAAQSSKFNLANPTFVKRFPHLAEAAEDDDDAGGSSGGGSGAAAP